MELMIINIINCMTLVFFRQSFDLSLIISCGIYLHNKRFSESRLLLLLFVFILTREILVFQVNRLKEGMYSVSLWFSFTPAFRVFQTSTSVSILGPSFLRSCR
ncbi:hypothetical protein MPTK1_7g17620 [Marchantia polymorpha subsp. ruderalis]